MEYVGLIISILALIFLFFKQSAAVKRQPGEATEELNEEEEEEDQSLLEYIQKREQQMKKKVIPPPAPPPVQKQTKPIRKGTASPLDHYRLESTVENRKLMSPLESRQLKPVVRQPSIEVHPAVHGDAFSRGPSRAHVVVSRLAQKKDLVIYQEIMDKPRGLRPY